MRLPRQRILALLRRELIRKALRPATIQVVRETMARFLRWSRWPLRRVRLAHVRGYLAARARTLSASSLRSELVRLRIAFQALTVAGALARDPTLALSLENPRPRHQLVLGERAVARLLQAASQGADHARSTVRAAALRDRACLELTYVLGLRKSEVAAARVLDLDLQGQSLVVRSAKRGRVRVLPITPAALFWIERWLREGRAALAQAGEQADQGRLLLNDRGRPLHARLGVTGVVARVGRRAGIVVTPHSLRRSIASHLIRAGVSVLAVQALLGHERLATTACYLLLEQDDLRRAVDLLERVRA